MEKQTPRQILTHIDTQTLTHRKRHIQRVGHLVYFNQAIEAETPVLLLFYPMKYQKSWNISPHRHDVGYVFTVSYYFVSHPSSSRRNHLLEDYDQWTKSTYGGVEPFRPRWPTRLTCKTKTKSLLGRKGSLHLTYWFIGIFFLCEPIRPALPFCYKLFVSYEPFRPAYFYFYFHFSYIFIFIF